MKKWMWLALFVAPSFLALSTFALPYLALMLLALILPGVAFSNPALIVIFILPLVLIAVLGESDSLLFIL
ncbi:MAG: hypothetical protein N0A16_08730 [Blastocatellia bacterium]|nr:hypothetical protein [Blastocatellia bacterium]MCS7157799.1 hypothetical protein [Blastocatellia bacterium]MCX7753312.1 hypothetical protein [Blastocatellia bacterium]MDW8168126.1 hypothetical protein [Acidobacteriota bacterium]MDW8257627.1 hypothetical protein [Acidobacteriota bacterium]